MRFPHATPVLSSPHPPFSPIKSTHFKPHQASSTPINPPPFLSIVVTTAGASAKWARLKAANRRGGLRLQSGAISSNPSDLRVPVLLTTAWNQSSNENYYTPKNRVCGCVATGGAQILYYWKWPQDSITAVKNYNGTVDGSLAWDIDSGYETTSGGARTAWDPPFGGTYNWTGMTSSDATTKKESISKLTRDVGLACYMDYASGGSSANYIAFHVCLTGQFGYKNSALRFVASGSISSDEIRRAILPSLDFKSPCAVGVPGHAIVADGYGYSGGYSDGTLYIHFNMGWGGSKNYWYNPPDLTDSGYSSFTSIDEIVYNIYPPTTCDTADRTIVSGRVLGSSCTPVSGIAVTAQKGTSSYTATTDDRGIYALLVPKNASYSIRAEQDNIIATTNVTVSNWSSAGISGVGHGGSISYYSTGSVGNIHGADITLNQVLEPVFSPTSGTTFEGSMSVTISCATPDAAIRYTLDGTEPTAESALYSGAITVSDSCTVKARAFKEGCVASATSTASYQLIVATPVLSPVTGTAFAGSMSVEISCATADAAIRYTLDGTEPTAESALYSGAITVSDSCTVKARAFKAGCVDSATVTASYQLIVADPVITPASGLTFFTDSLSVEIVCATGGAEIRYTLDGTEPTTESALYGGALAISSNTVVKARAFKAGCISSGTVAASYSHRALIGENLVQDTSPAQGETQMLSAPVAGTYAASFSYSGTDGRYGEGVELRLARGGVTNTLAAVSADGAGTFTTNLTFEVSDAGDYELFLYNPAPDAEQPVTVTDLSIMLPANKKNMRDYWIFETERTFGATGAWSEGAAFRDGRINVETDGEASFTPDTSSRGHRTVITSTMVFDQPCYVNEDYANVKAALHVGLDETTGNRVFQVLTSGGESNVWQNVFAEGVSEPALNTPYTFEFVLKRDSRTYSVSLVSGSAKTPLTAEGGVVQFPYASKATRSVERVRYTGEGGVTELYGRDGGNGGVMITVE